MRNLMISFVLLATVAATGSAAWAGGSPGSLGVGAESVFTGVGEDAIGGISANYDMGAFHFGGYLGVADPAGADNTTLQLGGRFFYHVHSSAMADFSVGGTLAYANVPTPGPDDEKNDLVYLVPGIQIRAFVASNVALSFSSGIALGLGDADGVALNGQLTSSAGIHYYFF
jgi:hypothetical protein